MRVGPHPHALLLLAFARRNGSGLFPPGPPPTAAAPGVSISCVTDADLVARAREGDDAAFGELVRRHHAAVYRAALAALGSPADAEDAAQDALLSAYRRLSGFRGAS